MPTRAPGQFIELLLGHRLRDDQFANRIDQFFQSVLVHPNRLLVGGTTGLRRLGGGRWGWIGIRRGWWHGGWWHGGWWHGCYRSGCDRACWGGRKRDTGWRDVGCGRLDDSFFAHLSECRQQARDCWVRRKGDASHGPIACGHDLSLHDVDAGEHQFESGAMKYDLTVPSEVEQILRLVGQCPHGIHSEHAGHTLDGVEAAVERIERLTIGRGLIEPEQRLVRRFQVFCSFSTEIGDQPRPLVGWRRKRS